MATTDDGGMRGSWSRVAALSAALAWSVPASATLFLDQSVVITNSSGDQPLFQISGDELQAAQTYTAQLGGQLAQVDLQLYRDAGAVSDLNFQLLRLTPTGFPSDDPADVLFTTTVSTASLPQLGVGTVPFTSVDVTGANLFVQPGDQLAISLNRFGDLDPGVYWRHGDSTYFDGDDYTRFTGFPWNSSGGLDDLGFQTFVEAGPPNPGLVNGAFETGNLTGWTPFLTPDGEMPFGLPDVLLNDTTGDGNSSPAARFRVGITDEAIDNGQFSPQGGGLRQTFVIASDGLDATFSLDVSSRHFGSSTNTEPGRFELIVDGELLDFFDFDNANIEAGQTLRGSLEGTVQGIASGEHTLELRVTRAANTSQPIFQYLDNITLVTTLCGDYNGSGQVEQGDLDLVLQNWGVDTDVEGVPGGWVNGLPEGQVEQSELDKVLQNWGNTAAPDFSGFHGANVPEPVGLVALLSGGMLARRRR